MARTNRESDKEYNRKYWTKHKDEINAKRKAKRTDENRPDRTKKVRQWREKNREYWNAYMREYHKRRKEAKATQIDKNN